MRHRSKGFIINDNGELDYDVALYNEAVYCGKVETYTESALESAKKPMNAMDMLGHMGDEHRKALLGIGESKPGEQLVPREPIRNDSQKLLDRMSGLKQLLDDGNNLK